MNFYLLRIWCFSQVAWLPYKLLGLLLFFFLLCSEFCYFSDLTLMITCNLFVWKVWVDMLEMNNGSTWMDMATKMMIFFYKNIDCTCSNKMMMPVTMYNKKMMMPVTTCNKKMVMPVTCNKKMMMPVTCKKKVMMPIAICKKKWWCLLHVTRKWWCLLQQVATNWLRIEQLLPLK